MIEFLLVLVIALFNLTLGFVLAVHFGHGPPWADLTNPLAHRRSAHASAQHSERSFVAGHRSH